MDKKKIAIIALVFIFLGTMIFAFANPKDEELKGNIKPSEVDKDKTTDDEKKEEETLGEEEANNNTNTVVNTNDGNNTDVVVDYYKLALEAVEKAESSLVQNDVDSAKDLINNVTTDQKDNLLDRINDVQNIIDFDKLLKVLENKTNSSTNKNELNDARDFNTSNLVADKLNSLKDSASKTDFEERYNTVLLTLNDVTDPVINGVTEGEYTKRELEIEVVEDTEYVITLDGEAYELGTTIEEGKHVIKVVDKAFNEKVVNFTIDRTAPTIEINNWKELYLTVGSTYVDEGATATDNIDEEISYIVEYLYYDENGNRITPDPTSIVLDKVGQFVIKYISIDKSKNRTEKTRRINVVSSDTVLIDSSEDLVDAISNQQDGQTWLFIKEGTYDVFNIDNYKSDKTGLASTNQWYGGYVTNKIEGNMYEYILPIYANNLTITKLENIGDVILTSSARPSENYGETWNYQNFVTISGSGVTISEIDLESNYNEYYQGTNKIIELCNNGKDLILKNINVISLENEYGKFGGSIYFNVEDVGNTILSNISIDAWINAKRVTTGKVSISNATIDFINSQYSGYYTEKDGYSWNPGISGTNVDVEGLTIKVDGNINLKEQVFNENLRPGTVIELSSDITISEPIEINESVTIDGKGHTIFGTGITGSIINGFIVKNGTVVFKNLTFTDFDENLDASVGSVIMIDADSINARVEVDNVTINDFVRDAFTFKAGTFKVTNSYIDCKPDENREKNLTKAFQIGFGNNKVTGVIENVNIQNSSSNYEEWGASAIEIYNNAEVEIIGGKISNTNSAVWVDHYWAGSSYYPSLGGNTKVTINGTEITAEEYAVIVYSREEAKDSVEVFIDNANLNGKVAYVDKTDNDSITINNSKINGISSNDYIIENEITQKEDNEEEA